MRIWASPSFASGVIRSLRCAVIGHGAWVIWRDGRDGQEEREGENEISRWSEVRGQRRKTTEDRGQRTAFQLGTKHSADNLKEG